MSKDRIELGSISESERKHISVFQRVFQDNPVPEEERMKNLHIFLPRQTLARLLFLNELYMQILKVPGVVMLCGVRWGGDLLSLTSLRALYEPYNYSRRIIGFDTFEGLKGVTEADQPPGGRGSKVLDGQYNVTSGYERVLEELLLANEQEAPLSHIPKHELIKGDVCETIPQYMRKYPGEQIALLYLDLDVYMPTKSTLINCMERVMPGSIIVFDEFSHLQFPGEAQAYRELTERFHLRVRRSQFSTVAAYGVVTS